MTTEAQASAPVGRRQEVLDVAAVLFRERGYDGVTMQDIAAELGLTSAALYHHVTSKQDLMAELLTSPLDAIGQAVSGTSRVEEVVPAIVVTCMELDAPHLLHRLLRSARLHLKPELTTQVDTALAPTLHHIRAAVRCACPTASAEEVELRARAILAVASSTTRHRVTAGRHEVAATLTAAAVQVASLPLATEVVAQPTNAQQPKDRRALILASAGQLFSARGYRQITIADIARESDIVASSVYNHFRSKQDILYTVVDDEGRALLSEVEAARADAPSADTFRRRVVGSFVERSLNSLNPLRLLEREINQLPAEAQDALRQVQRDYLAVWAGFVRQGGLAALLLPHAAVALINALVQMPGVRERPAAHAEILELALAVLTSDSLESTVCSPHPE